MNLALDTDSTDATERFPYWRDAMLRHFGLHIACAPRHQPSFRASLAQYGSGPLLLREVAATPYALTRPAPAREQRVVVQLQIRGSSLIRQDGQEIRLQAGQIGLFCNGRPIQIERRDRFQTVSLCVARDAFSNALPHWHHETLAAIPGDRGAAAVFWDALVSLARQAGSLDGASLDILSHSMLSLLGAALRPHGEVPRQNASHLELYHKNRIRKYALSRLHDPELDVATIAHGVGLSPRYIHRLFSVEPLHLMQWVMAQRLEQCRQALDVESPAFRSISELAYSWGFKDPAHFSKAFRRQFGICPRELHKHRQPGPEV